VLSRLPHKWLPYIPAISGAFFGLPDPFSQSTIFVLSLALAHARRIWVDARASRPTH